MIFSNKTVCTKFYSRDTKNGGPVHWIHNNYACPNCVKNPDNKCCQDVPEGHFCKPDSYNIEQDNDVTTSIWFQRSPIINIQSRLDLPFASVLGRTGD